MKVGKQFNTLTQEEYLHLIGNYKKFTDFNTLGLFRSIVENTKLSLEQKLELRQVAVAAFAKSFDFLQLKDPQTFFEVSTLGETLTKADEMQAWENIKRNQQRILDSKQLNHRNFGTYSKHICDYATCHLNGLMIKTGSHLAYGGPMRFHSDNHHSWSGYVRAERHKQDRKAKRRLITQQLDSE
ncbi:hypothetical protein [Hymenobacter lapidiphilus]|uniref:Uncharacterized protein n=1 Tax=Hymenobacter lapidiphilus TaxID=2608003 RepID=A0A7Y7U3Y2_9BACT|nr:hypothetical protein [Hymenobacter lapidiphilus]NVO29697.1 hypothetical protein [Hymenobacter lapidiphilus]